MPSAVNVSVPKTKFCISITLIKLIKWSYILSYHWAQLLKNSLAGSDLSY